MRNIDYDSLDISSLTLADALDDEDWGKRPADISKFFAVDLKLIRHFKRFTDDELASFMRAVYDYVENGQLPDYESESFTTAVVVTLESVISAHEERVNSAYLNSYKAYVKGKKTKKKN